MRRTLKAGAEYALKLIENVYKLTMGYFGCRTSDEVRPNVIA